METRPLFVHCCHCRWCQRETGASFALNAMIEADRVTRIALWSTYAGAGPVVRFVRVGTLDDPDALTPDIHIFTASKQPWVVIPHGAPSVPEYYDREKYWPPESLARRQALLPRIEAYQASLRAGR